MHLLCSRLKGGQAVTWHGSPQLRLSLPVHRHMADLEDKFWSFTHQSVSIMTTYYLHRQCSRLKGGWALTRHGKRQLGLSQICSQFSVLLSGTDRRCRWLFIQMKTTLIITIWNVEWRISSGAWRLFWQLECRRSAVEISPSALQRSGPYYKHVPLCCHTEYTLCGNMMVQYGWLCFGMVWYQMVYYGWVNMMVYSDSICELWYAILW